MLLTAIFLCVLAVSNAHVCLISPPQRGSMMGLNTKGSDDCFLTTGPCGGRMARPRDGEGFAPGENVTVTFQKNLDHYNATSPGYFALNFGNETKMEELARIPDKGEVALHLYSLNVTLPREVHHPGPGHVMQVVYHPNNAQAPADFYQCADIMLGKPGPPGR